MEPAIETELGGHDVQALEPAASAYVLAGQVVHDVAPASEDEPVGQAVLGALTGHFHPGGHGVHVPVLFSYPGKHVHDVPYLYRPLGHMHVLFSSVWVDPHPAQLYPENTVFSGQVLHCPLLLSGMLAYPNQVNSVTRRLVATEYAIKYFPTMLQLLFRYECVQSSLYDEYTPVVLPASE